MATDKTFLENAQVLDYEIRKFVPDSLNNVAINVTAPVLKSQTTWSHGAKSGIGTTAVKLTASSIVATRGVFIKASELNSGYVFVGSSASVTAGTADATSGWEMGPGSSHFLEVSNISAIWVIASATNQKVYWEVF